MRKKQFLLGGLVLAIFVLTGAGCVQNSVQTPTDNRAAVTAPAIDSVKTEAPVQTQATVQTDDDGLSNDNYYTNVDGNQVHAPAYEEQANTIPSGATALCSDGTYSFSQNRRGTCSHHGGVSEWLN
jgi:hypothetical protein